MTTVPSRAERLAARAVVLAIDPALTPHDLAARLSRLAGHRRVLLENALRRVAHRDPHGRSPANTRAAIGLRLALGHHNDDLSPT